MNSLQIRPAAVTDAGAVAALVNGLAAYYGSGTDAGLPDWFRQTLTPDAFRDRLNDPQYHHYIALYDEKLAGYLALREGFHLYHPFVAEQAHRRGIARQLWQHALGQLPIETCTVRSSLFAVPVYQRLGFRLSGEAASKDGIAFQPMLFNASDNI